MDAEARPDPPPAERDALLQALRAFLNGTEGAAPPRWWREGIRENVLGDDEEDRLREA